MNAPSTTRTCPKCNNSVAADTKFCPNCGAAVSGIFSGGGSAMEGTAVLGVEAVDTLFPILQEATLGDYDIYGELGRGGMAAVYLALDLALNRKVAIKTMLPDLVSKTGMVDRFKREAQTAAGLSHPHIIQIFSVKQTKSLVYFVMKYIEGRSLESVIVERGKLEVDLARVILSQVGGALAFAHRKGVVHRDMKPANIMLEEDGWAIVTDFGIAKVQEAQNLTATGTAIGTPHYMSPEQFHNKAVTGTSDQYSLGVVAYEMLTGRKPFDGATYAEIITQHLFEPPPDLRSVRPDVPDNVAQTIMRMMAKEASARFPDLDAAVASLGAATTTQGEKARTQMIQLAKGGGERKVRMSIPQSPIPAQRKPAEATVVEDRRSAAAAAAAARKAAQRPEPSKGKSHAFSVIAAILLIAIGGGGTWAYLTGKLNLASLGIGNVSTPAIDKKVSSAPAPKTTPDSVTLASAGQTNVPPAAAAIVPPVDSTPAAVVNPPVEVKPTATKTKTREPKSGVASTKTSGGKGDGTKTAGTTKTSTKSAAPEKKAAVVADRPAPAAEKPPAPVETKPAAPASVQVRIGSHTPAATLYVNGQTQGLIGSLSWLTLPVKSDGQLKLEIRADNCSTKWDTTIVVPPGSTDKITVGWRQTGC
jgi:serine/threonine-protein kinase